MSAVIKSFLCLSLLSFFSLSAGFEDTREILAAHCEENCKVMTGYDRLVASWEAYFQAVDTPKMAVLLQSVEYAAKKHAGQVRKDREQTPYIVHCLGVAERLWETGGIRDVDVLSAALLHDTLEDTSATYDELSARFGERIAHIVQEVTNDPNLSSRENKQRQVDHAPFMSHQAKLVKLADRLYNICDLRTPPPSWSEEKVNQYFEWGGKLLVALEGTNIPLEEALKAEIVSHKKCVTLERI